jgi:uncharacterized protein (TIGR00251 family)
VSDPLELTEVGGSVRFWVRVKPRASKSRVLGPKLGKLEVAVAAPPVDGEANEELVRVLSEHLGVGRRAVSIVSGEASRNKLVSVAGLRRDAVLAKTSA